MAVSRKRLGSVFLTINRNEARAIMLGAMGRWRTPSRFERSRYDRWNERAILEDRERFQGITGSGRTRRINKKLNATRAGQRAIMPREEQKSALV
jgi:hypothetical protein